jgi:hypothetical protein
VLVPKKFREEVSAGLVLLLPKKFREEVEVTSAGFAPVVLPPRKPRDNL